MLNISCTFFGTFDVGHNAHILLPYHPCAVLQYAKNMNSKALYMSPSKMLFFTAHLSSSNSIGDNIVLPRNNEKAF